MQLPQDFTEQLAALVSHWLIPLFILYNIVGWMGLPNREAARSIDTKYTDSELAKLQQALRAAWFVGVLTAVLALWIVLSIKPDSSAVATLAPAAQSSAATEPSATPPGESGAAGSTPLNANSLGIIASLLWAVLGLGLGVFRVLFPHSPRFRGLDRHWQRLILAGLVFLSVAVSLTSGVIYLSPDTCTSCAWWKQVIAYSYAFMLIGYSITLVYQAAK